PPGVRARPILTHDLRPSVASLGPAVPEGGARSLTRPWRCGVPPVARLGASALGELSSTEPAAVERAAAEPMLDQVLAWSAVNSGSKNLGGLERMADLLTDAFT